MLNDFLFDFRYAARMLKKNPGFAAIAIGTLTLGIGANTAIFSVVDGVILRPLSYSSPERLFAVHEVVPKFANIAPLVPVNAMHFQGWRKNWSSAESLALISSQSMNLTGVGEPVRLNAGRVSSSLFPMLGVRARLGRTLLEEEDQPGRDHVVVLSDELWKRQFSADPKIVGRKIILDGNPFEVVGVLAPGFRFPKISQLYAMTIGGDRPELWKPFAIAKDELEEMGDFNYTCIARLRTGVTRIQALSELNVVQANFARQTKDRMDLLAEIVPLREQITGRGRAGLLTLLAAVGAILLIACVNVANLLLSRATGRRREIAIRSAVGASRSRLLRQMLSESILLAAVSGILGTALAAAAVKVLVTLAPVDLPRIDEVGLNLGVLAFTMAITLSSALLFGALPAWRLGHTDPQDALKSGARGSTEGHAGGRLRSILVGVEVGLSALCLIAGGLLLHSFVKLLSVDKGFETSRILTVDLSIPDARYPDLEKRAALLHAVVERVSALPGVVSAGLSNMLPLGGEGGNNIVQLEGQHLPIPERPLADIRQVSPAYWRTMGIPLQAGRFFSDADRSRKTALVSSLTARRLWPGQNAVGKRFRMGDDDSPLIEVVGITGDVRSVNLNTPPTLTIYIPYWQRFYGNAALAIRTAAAPAGIATATRAALREVEPQMPVPAFKTMDELVSESVSGRRFQLVLVLLFGLAALVLASLGIYGVVSYSAAQRSNEMGIRMALGATPSSVRALVMREGLTPVVVGLGAGIACALAVGRLLQNLLFGVRPADPITIAGVSLLLVGVAVIAGYVPARRATLVDPLTALRYE
jgi:putative ABC transport system permease protein